MMIEIELTWALAVYSAILGLLIATIWLYTELSIRHPQRQLGKQFLWRCTFCGYRYLDEESHVISQCPRCTNLNSVEEREGAPSPNANREEPSDILTGTNIRNTSKRKRRGRARGPRRRSR
jgi:phage FluMu protein Com